MSGDRINIIFSDVDGTLVHYPKEPDVETSAQEGYEIFNLPASATGMKGVISGQTLLDFTKIRKQGVKLVLVSGMRTSTLLKRIPFLPKADAYCSENGGRIFYPDPSLCTYSPIPFHGAQQEDLKPFGLVEDSFWRAKMEREDAAGKESFVGNEIIENTDKPIPISDRRGLLWTFARELEERGLVLDEKGYATCFRVNDKHQSQPRGLLAFQKLINEAFPILSGLRTSQNLGCIDFYPKESGKLNCCQYLTNRWRCGTMERNCLCLCDDDNDLEMALSCRHVYVPRVSSESMWQTIETNPDKFTVTARDGKEGTRSTDSALALVLDALNVSANILT